MKLLGHRARRAAAAVSLLASAVYFSGCEVFSSGQNTLSPKGDVADRQADLLWLVIWIALAVLIIVFAALVYALFRFRRRSDDEALPKQVHGNTRLELTWTILPTLLLLGLAVPIIDGIFYLGTQPGDEALHVRVIATQWNWRFEYLDEEYQTPDGEPLSVQRELHIPLDRDVDAELEARDVIHSFSVPALAGKLDAIPGRTNKMWFNATQPGTFGGQCLEFCGTGHPGMKFEVVAESQADFDAWIQEQLAGEPAPSAPPPDGG